MTEHGTGVSGIGPSRPNSCNTILAYDADTRYSKRIRRVEGQLFEVMTRSGTYGRVHVMNDHDDGNDDHASSLYCQCFRPLNTLRVRAHKATLPASGKTHQKLRLSHDDSVVTSILLQHGHNQRHSLVALILCPRARQAAGQDDCDVYQLLSELNRAGRPTLQRICG